MKGLVAIPRKPEVPPTWNYDESVARVKQLVYKWKNLTLELATELWVAREVLRLTASTQPRSSVGTFVPADKTWSDYCREIGSSRQVVDRWLKNWFDFREGDEPLPLPPEDWMGEDLGIITGDLSELHNNGLLPDDSADLFFTDPPYGEEHLELYGKVAELAQAKLKPGGLCLAYAPHPHLPQVIRRMEEHLDYWWIFAIEQTGQEPRIWKNRIWVRWKPILVFTKRPATERLTDSWVQDSIRGAGEDKRYHQWGQDVREAAYWIEVLTPSNGLVVDPLCGGGTIPVASKVTGRRWLATEIDPSIAAAARRRLKELEIAVP